MWGGVVFAGQEQTGVCGQGMWGCQEELLHAARCQGLGAPTTPATHQACSVLRAHAETTTCRLVCISETMLRTNAPEPLLPLLPPPLLQLLLLCSVAAAAAAAAVAAAAAAPAETSSLNGAAAEGVAAAGGAAAHGSTSCTCSAGVAAAAAAAPAAAEAVAAAAAGAWQADPQPPLVMGDVGAGRLDSSCSGGGCSNACGSCIGCCGAGSHGSRVGGTNASGALAAGGSTTAAAEGMKQGVAQPKPCAAAGSSCCCSWAEAAVQQPKPPAQLAPLGVASKVQPPLLASPLCGGGEARAVPGEGVPLS